MAITAVGESQEFVYSGNMQTFLVPMSGLYQLEVYGSKGGASIYGGYTEGGYSKGYTLLKKGETLYICCGGIPYNGGGSPSGSDAGTIYTGSTAGGGATHIAKRAGLLSELENHKNDILIVAGGAGGSVGQTYYAKDLLGGAGGGTSGGKGKSYNGTSFYDVGNGGTQSAGGKGDVSKSTGSFGKGGDGYGACGGGGGYYGGSGGTGYNSGGGGSGYIGGVPRIEYKGKVYEPQTVLGGGLASTGKAILTLIEKSIPLIYAAENGVAKEIDGIFFGSKEISDIKIID